MSHFRRKLAELEAAQYQPTHEEPLTFSDRPDWLDSALEVGTVSLNRSLHGLAVVTRQGTVIAIAGDWLIRDSDGNLRVRGNTAFTDTYEPHPALEEEPTP